MEIDNKDNEIIDNFVNQHLNPLKNSFLNMNESQFNDAIRNIQNEYENVKKSAIDKSKLNNIHFYNDILSLQSQYREVKEKERLEAERKEQEQIYQLILQQKREKLEEERKEAERIKQEQLLQQQAEEERKRKEIERMLNIPPPPPVYVEDYYERGGCSTFTFVICIIISYFLF